MDSEKIKQLGVAVLETEANAILALKSRVDDKFVHACTLLFGCNGRIVVSGMGKSGHVGGKIAATLASTGSPAFFVHPGEAAHGDLGMISDDDVVIALSNSGETGELLTIAPILRRRGIELIALTGNPQSSLAELASVHIDISVASEACPLGLAPTASTSAALAMGDALAIALLERRGFTPDDFARSHPGGSLGRRLLLHIDDVMRSGEQIPVVPDSAKLSATLLEMSQKGLGMTAVVDTDNRAVGVFTDGDLRRTLDQGIDVHSCTVESVMTREFKRMHRLDLAADAVQLMQKNKITSVLVLDDNDALEGVLHMHDLLKAGAL
ncbi:MAG: KpsF/GutQ family sugar-phosphate isomerase [Pseudomonadota bacterium]